jgi:hypothetical protein
MTAAVRMRMDSPAVSETVGDVAPHGLLLTVIFSILPH